MSSLTNQASNSSLKTSKHKIEKLVFGGSGLSRDGGCVTFIPFTAPGDIVLASITKKKKNYQVGKVEKLIEEGAGRRLPKCPHFKTCGGCQLQHLNIETQRACKQVMIEDALKAPAPITLSQKEWEYRSHIRLNLKPQKEGFLMGYIGTDQKTLVPPSTCPLFLDDPQFFATLKEELSSIPNQGIRSASLRIFKAPQGIVLAFSFFPKIPKNFPFFSCAAGVCMKAPGQEKHFDDTSLTQTILGRSVAFSPFGFMQCNLPIAEMLYQAVLDEVGTTPQKILDLYAGIGITSAFLADQGHDVLSIESNRQLKPCAPHFKMLHGTVETLLPKMGKSFHPNVILVNPPKTGLSKEIFPLLNAQKLLYISCNPSTLARDLNHLKDYKLKKIKGFDMFPQTTHVETLAILEKT